MDSRLRGNDGLDYRSLTRMGSLTRMRVGDTFGALGLNEGRCQDGCRAEDSQLHGAGLLDPEDVRGRGRAQGEIRSGQRLRPVAWQPGGRAPARSSPASCGGSWTARRPGCTGICRTPGIPRPGRPWPLSWRTRRACPSTANSVIMTCGAGGALNIVMKTLLDPGDEVVIFAPYFVEYAYYADNHGGSCRVVPHDDGFLPDFAALEDAIGPRTRIVLVSSPSNPTGVVYSADVLSRIGEAVRPQGVGARHRDFPRERRAVPQDTVRRNRVPAGVRPPPEEHRRHFPFQGPGASRRADRVRGSESQLRGRRRGDGRADVLQPHAGIRERPRRSCSTSSGRCRG